MEEKIADDKIFGVLEKALDRLHERHIRSVNDWMKTRLEETAATKEKETSSFLDLLGIAAFLFGIQAVLDITHICDISRFM